MLEAPGVAFTSVGAPGLSLNWQTMVLAGDSPDAYNDVGRPDRVIPQEREVALTGNTVELPPHSVAVVRLTV